MRLQSGNKEESLNADISSKCYDHTLIPLQMITEIGPMMVERLEAFRKQNGRLPDSIIVYRDGVSESISPSRTIPQRECLLTQIFAGQFKAVLNEELPRVYEACGRMSAGYKPKITIIIVGKRHHTRFYPTDKAMVDRKGNPAPGTVVDRGITAAYDFDFFLQAHAGLQGTTRPAHYYVLHDENGFRANSLQSLVFLPPAQGIVRHIADLLLRLITCVIFMAVLPSLLAFAPPHIMRISFASGVAATFMECLALTTGACAAVAATMTLP